MSSTSLHLTGKVEAGKPVLLCLPGTFCSPTIFDLLDGLAFPDLSILSIDWMTSPGPWDIPTLGRRVAQCMRFLQPAPIVLAGHSTGGLIALVAALAEPDLVSGLVLADTGANTHGHGDITGLLQIVKKGIDEAFVRLLLSRSFASPPEPALQQRLMTYALNAPREAALSALQSQIELDLSDSLVKLAMPALVVHGRYDQARPVAHALFLVEHLPAAELCLLETGHTPMVEDPRGYEEALKSLGKRARLPFL